MNDRTANPDERLVWEHQCSLRHRINVASQSKRAQVIKKTGIKQWLVVVTALRGKILDFVLAKLKFAHKIDNLRQSARQSELATKRIFAENNVKRRLVIAHPGFPIATRHRDLVKVSIQC